MENVFRFLARSRVFFLFLVIEVIALFMIVRSSYYQSTKIMNSVRYLQAMCEEQVNSWEQYFSLKNMNADLAEENNRLRKILSYYQSVDTTKSFTEKLPLYPDYEYTLATVIDNSVNRQHNYITLNVGKNHQIEPDMGVMVDNGVVGIITSVTGRYALVKSFLNTDWKVSARLLRSGAFGPLHWDGKIYTEALLSEIPQHIDVQVGDTVVTSGYSSIFPPDIPIGIVKSFQVKRGNFYEIKVALLTDYKRLRYVTVARFTQRDEINQLDSKTHE